MRLKVTNEPSAGVVEDLAELINMIKRNIYRSARCRWFESGLSRVFHDIWLLGICLEILFSSASNLPTLSNHSTLVPPHIVPMYFKCSVH